MCSLFIFLLFFVIESVTA